MVEMGEFSREEVEPDSSSLAGVSTGITGLDVSFVSWGSLVVAFSSVPPPTSLGAPATGPPSAGRGATGSVEGTEVGREGWDEDERETEGMTGGRAAVVVEGADVGEEATVVAISWAVGLDVGWVAGGGSDFLVSLAGGGGARGCGCCSFGSTT